MPPTLESLTDWLLTRGVHVVAVLLFAVIATRLIRFIVSALRRAGVANPEAAASRN